MAVSPTSRKHSSRVARRKQKPYSRPEFMPTPSPSPTPTPTPSPILHHRTISSLISSSQHPTQTQTCSEHETEMQKTLRLMKEEVASAAYIKACPGCKKAIYRVFDRVVDNKNMTCYCGCKFCWRCGFARKECGCPLTAMVVHPDAVRGAVKEGERWVKDDVDQPVSLSVEGVSFNGAST